MEMPLLHLLLLAQVQCVWSASYSELTVIGLLSVVSTQTKCLIYTITFSNHSNLLGGFTKYTLVAIPTIIGTLNSFFLNEKIAKLFARSEMTVVSTQTTASEKSFYVEHCLF